MCSIFARACKFHNGADLTAEDVKATVERILDESTGSQYRGDLLPIASRRRHRQVHRRSSSWRTPYSGLLAALFNVLIVPKEVRSRPLDYLKNQEIGTGPWMLDSWNPNVDMHPGAQPELLGRTIDRTSPASRSASCPRNRRSSPRCAPAKCTTRSSRTTRTTIWSRTIRVCRRGARGAGHQCHQYQPSQGATVEAARAPGDEHGHRPRRDLAGGRLRLRPVSGPIPGLASDLDGAHRQPAVLQARSRWGQGGARRSRLPERLRHGRHLHSTVPADGHLRAGPRRAVAEDRDQCQPARHRVRVWLDLASKDLRLLDQHQPGLPDARSRSVPVQHVPYRAARRQAGTVGATRKSTHCSTRAVRRPTWRHASRSIRRRSRCCATRSPRSGAIRPNTSTSPHRSC